MLALLITSPETAAGLVYRIRFRSADHGKFTELAADHLAETGNKTRKSAGKGTSAEQELNSLAHLEEQIRKVMGQDQVQDDLAVFRRWVTPVARFSFRSDDHDASLR